MAARAVVTTAALAAAAFRNCRTLKRCLVEERNHKLAKNFRLAEMQLFGDGHEVAEAAQVDHFYLSGINGDRNGIGVREVGRSDCP